MSIFNFFNTAPKVISDKVRDLEKAGRMRSVIEAIEAERKNRNEKGIHSGTSKDGSITVKRLGGYTK